MRYLKPAAFLFLIMSGSTSLLSRAAIAQSLDSELEGEPTTSQSTERFNLSTSENSQSATGDESIASTEIAPKGPDDLSSQNSRRNSLTVLASLLDSARGMQPDKSLLQQPRFISVPSVSDTRSPDFTQESRTTGLSASEQPTDEQPTNKIAAADLGMANPADSTPSSNIIEADRSRQLAQQSSERLTLEELRRLMRSPTPNPDQPQAAPDLPSDLPSLEPEELSDPTPIEAPATEDPETQPTATSDIGQIPDILFADPNPLNIPTMPEDVEIDQDALITLDQAVELAYRNNQTLQSAVLALEQADEVVREARAARLPTVTTSATLNNIVDDGDTQTTLGGQIEATYDVFTGGSRAASIKAAELQREVSALAVEVQQEQLRLATATVYYALQEASEQIRINQSFVNEAERNLRDSRLRQEVGVGTRFDVLRAEVQFANARQQVIQSQSDERIARRDIARLLNLPPTSDVKATPVAVAEDWPLTLEDSIVLALQNRAELEQQLLTADLNEQQRKIALAALRPQVGLFARYNIQEQLAGESSPFVDDFQDSATFGAQFSMTLFNGGASRAQARQREIDSAIAEETFSENADQFRFDVEQSFYNLESNKENIATSRVAVAQAEEALELANLRLQAGVGTQLDVLTAQSELTQAESNNITAILGYNRALAAMQRAVSNLGLFLP